MKRSSHRSGEWLMMDQISGVVRYRSQMSRDWDGTWRDTNQLDGKHPTLFFRPFIKETAPQDTSPVPPYVAEPLTVPKTVGTTNVPRKPSPADWLFQ